MEFKEGGAFDFASIFERLKERLRQAVDVARESGADSGDGGNTVGGVNMNSVHLDDLPAYEDSRQDRRVPEESLPSPQAQNQRSNGPGPAIAAPEPTSPQRANDVSSPQGGNFQPPLDPPPGYEEVQRGSIVEELERQARRMSNE